MNKQLKIITSLLLTSVLAGCASSNDSPFGTGGTATGSNIISEKNFTLFFDETNPAVIDTDGIYHTGVEVKVSVQAADHQNVRVNGGTVYFATDWGTLSTNTCELVNGSCATEITWTSDSNFDCLFFPCADEIVTFTAWTIGEESYTDINNDGIFDDNDIFLNDTSGPFLDENHNDVYDAGDIVLTPGNTSGQLTAADSLFNGLACTHSSLCSTNTSVYLSSRAYLSIREAP